MAGVILPQPGTPAFTPALVSALACAPALRGWRPDGTLVAVLLLALMTRRGGVLIDAAGGVGKVSKVVGAHTASVFGLETRYIHLGAGSVAADVVLGRHTNAGDAGTSDSQGEGTVNSTQTPPAPMPRAVVITGLEDAPRPVTVRLRSEIAAAERARSVPLIVWVRDEDRADDAAPAWLIDTFACSALLYADDLVSPPPGLGVTVLVSPDYIMDLRSLLLLTHIHPPLESHINNLLAALSLHPTLEANLSARATACLNTLVKGQRILAGPFDLPEGWIDHLHAWRAAKWAELEYEAGVGSSLPASALQPPGITGGGGFGGGRGGVETWSQRAGEVPTPETMLGPGATDWYCDPDNVEGAWELAVRHRVRARRHGQTMLFARDGSAQERVQYARGETGGSREAARRRRKEVDDALVQILQDV